MVLWPACDLLHAFVAPDVILTWLKNEFSELIGCCVSCLFPDNLADECREAFTFLDILANFNISEKK